MQRRKETETEIWCGACKRMEPKSNFGKRADAYGGLNYVCRDVASERNRRAHAKASEHNNERHRISRRARKLSDDAKIWALKKLVADARRRARERKVSFALSIDDLQAPEFCPVFGTRLVYQADQRRCDMSASLDRIESSLGYVPGNVWIISWRANQIKSDATADELRKVAGALDIISKARAGRFLDGVEYSEFPEAR